jgi:CheY-like chemotaxis protein
MVLLLKLKIKVEATTSPIDALNLFRAKPDQFDLVITDLTMPKMTGDKLVKEILSIRADMRIIICTGFTEKMDGEKAAAIGASGYLEKPHEKRNLARMVRQVLDEKKGKFCVSKLFIRHEISAMTSHYQVPDFSLIT